MGYHMNNGRFADVEDLILVARQVVDADGNGDATELGDRAVARVTLEVHAAPTGTNPTLDVDIETSPDGINWHVAASFVQATGVTSQRLAVPVDRFVRAAWTVGGTDSPGFTYGVSGEAA